MEKIKEVHADQSQFSQCRITVAAVSMEPMYIDNIGTPWPFTMAL